MDRLLISFGHGFSARALASRLQPSGWKIVGTTRSAEKCETLKKDGILPVVWPGTDLSPYLEKATDLLISTPPDAGGDPVLSAYRDKIAEVAPRLRWVGYLSTTGVYGNHDAAWVDETTPLAPTTQRGKRRAAAEADWQTIPGLPLHIFRLAGIYGPGRGPFAKVRNGTARRIIKAGQVFSRIHVEDIAQALALSLQAPDPGAVYNLCDDDPAPPQEVIAFAAELLGLPVPEAVPFEEAEMTPMARSFYAESKRVRNDRIKDELGVVLKYPDFRTTLRAMLSAEQHSA